MGCGATSGVVILESPVHAPVLETPPIVVEKPIFDQKMSDVELELKLLKINAHALTIENEKLKTEMNRDMSALFPQVFTSALSADELIEEWLLLDLFEGDKQVEYFGILHPAAQHLIDSVKRYSASIKAKETSLSEYLTYFKYRYEEGSRTLGLMGEEKIQVDDCVQQTKTRLVTAIKQYETLFGKKSAEVDNLREIFNFVQQKPQGADFINGLQNFYETTVSFHVAHYEAKLKSAIDKIHQLKSDHSRLLSDLQKQHNAELRAKDDQYDRHQKQWGSILKKQTDDVETIKAAFRLDLDNQLLHFDAHCRKLRTNFDKEIADSRVDLEATIAQLHREIEQREAVIQSKDEKIADMQSVIDTHEAIVQCLRDVNCEHESVIRELSIIVSDQRDKLEFFETEMAVKADMELEYSSLQAEISRLLEVQTDLQSQLQFSQADVSAKDARILALEAQFVAEAESQRQKWKQSTTIRITTRYAARMRLERAAVLLVWHAIATLDDTPHPIVSIPVPKSPYPHNVVDVLTEETFEPEQQQFANELIQERADITLKCCELSEMYAIIAQKEKPMIPQQIFKIFEEMITRKIESDQTDIKNDRLPRGIPAFLFEHLSRSVGLKPLAIKAINQFVPGLQQLHSQGHPYGLVICQILQVFHEDPVNYLMGLYLTEVLSHYDTLTQKFEKIKSERSSTRGVKKSTAITPRMRKQMKPYLGGNAFLQDVMTLVYTLFDTERGIGEKVIKMIHPEELSLEAFVTFLICQKMAKLGRTPESLFRLLDPNGVGSVYEIDFVSRIRESLDLWLPEVSLRVLFRSMAKKEKRLTQSGFTSAINFAAYSGNCTNEEYTVPACNFLIALIQVFKENEKKFAMRTKKLLDDKGIYIVTGNEFDDLVSYLDPNLRPSEISELWMLSLNDTGNCDSLTPQQFIMTLLNRPIGKLRDSVFCKCYSDKKEVTALLLRSNSTSPSLSTIESVRSLSPSSPSRIRSPFAFDL